jgi:hypothetical protein
MEYIHPPPLSEPEEILPFISPPFIDQPRKSHTPSPAGRRVSRPGNRTDSV